MASSSLSRRMPTCSRPSVRSGAVVRPSVSRSRVMVASAQQQTTTAATKMPRWEGCFNYLTGKKLQSITPEEAQERVASGEWVLVDVRLKEQHQTGKPTGAVNVPLYETIDLTGLDFRRAVKAFMYKSNGVNPVDQNPRFSAQMREAAAGGKGVILTCEVGGTMRPSVNFPEGKASRSLQAAFVTIYENIVPAEKVVHLDRGVYGWYSAGLPIEGNYTPDIGRSPMAAQEPAVKKPESGEPKKEEKKGWFF